MRWVVIALCIVLAGVAALGAWAVFFAGPALNLSQTDGGLHVDTKFLGEYCIGLSEVHLSEQVGGRPIWVLRPIEPPYMGLCEFDLSLGDNPKLPPQLTDAVAISPADSATFQLAAGVPYTLRVCGNNGSAYDRCSDAKFQFPGKW